MDEKREQEFQAMRLALLNIDGTARKWAVAQGGNTPLALIGKMARDALGMAAEQVDEEVRKINNVRDGERAAPPKPIADVVAALDQCASQIIHPKPDKVFAPAAALIRELHQENADLLAACKAVREQLISHMQGEWPGTMSITAKRVDDMLVAAITKVKDWGPQTDDPRPPAVPRVPGDDEWA